MVSNTQTEQFDVIIAGAGITGILAASRLQNIQPTLRIGILERLSTHGGRLRSSFDHTQDWSLGFNAISQELYEFMLRSFPLMEDSEDVSPVLSFHSGRQSDIGILSGQKLTEIGVNEIFSPYGIRALAGQSALGDWKDLEDALNFSDEDKFLPLSKKIKFSKKSPIISLFGMFSAALGISDLWSASLLSIKQRIEYFSSSLLIGDWVKGLNILLNSKENSQALTPKLITKCRIVQSSYHEGSWTLHTEQGEFKAPKLLVAQSPWEAVEWLDQKACPSYFLSLGQKFQPVSLVSLTYRLDKELPVPSLLWIPAEDVQMVKNHPLEICFQVIIDYEHSLDAPDVVKAIKRLKRSFKRIHNLYGQGMSTPHQEFLALHPVGWAQSAHAHFKRFIENFDYDKLNSPHLAFCSDAYGDSYHPDRNLIKSLLAACTTLCEEKRKPR